MKFLCVLLGAFLFWAGENYGDTIVRLAAGKLGYIHYEGIVVQASAPPLISLPAGHDYTPPGD